MLNDNDEGKNKRNLSLSTLLGRVQGRSTVQVSVNQLKPTTSTIHCNYHIGTPALVHDRQL